MLSRLVVLAAESTKDMPGKVDFNRDIRAILSENCYKCHGPDDGSRKARLRLDVRENALKPAKSGLLPVVPGAPEKSELIARVTAKDEDDRMPPLQSGKVLTSGQIELLRRWISQGAPYAQHWAYVKPVRPSVPDVRNRRWLRNPIDSFILTRLEKEGLTPSPQADRYTLIRRVSLDLTGLPPSPQEVHEFVSDRNPKAYEQLVDRLLSKASFGEHWTHMWLDLARYADSAGYADDPPRTIWGYRDYVIRSFNANKPFNRFTIEQIAGDLLPDATEEDRLATAFHRNTMTNNEGGTDDEEFRNAAVVDRINTTMAVWMATSFGCAQCHTHKYDPISHLDYFRFFAIFNNTEDADRPDEAPVIEYLMPAQNQERLRVLDEIAGIEREFRKTTTGSISNQTRWERGFPLQARWVSAQPTIKYQTNKESRTLEFPLPVARLSALRLTAAPPLAGVGNSSSRTNDQFILKQLSARILPKDATPVKGRFVHVALPGKEKILSLAEVQVLRGNINLALSGTATQSSTAYDGVARLAIDGRTDGNYETAKSTTHTETSENPWWEVDLGHEEQLDRIVIWNRTDNGLQTRLQDFRLSVLDEKRKPVWENVVRTPPNPSSEFALDISQPVSLEVAYPHPLALEGSSNESKAKERVGWVFGSSPTNVHELTFVSSQPVIVAPNSKLRLSLETSGLASAEDSPLEISLSEDSRFGDYADVPAAVLELLALSRDERDHHQQEQLQEYYRANVDPSMAPSRARLAELKKDLAGLKPSTVPIIRELVGQKRRVTHVQLRGNFLALGDEVTEALPASLYPLAGVSRPTRLDVAHWLVDENNPLTARVIVNRFWEQIFGVGIVRTCEDFGSQGDRPTHPELLDWLATEFVSHGWDVKAFLKELVTSAAYCQSSRVTPELQERDPDNLLLARGPRFRMPAEEVRDQALAISGLLSPKIFGPSVRPPRPSFGLSAAFGGSLDWKNSEGEDRYRRALYVEWRRTSPYPSMATFDAPNREVCTLRRPRSNTPLQALVTLNDPVYVEAAQALGRRMAQTPGSLHDKLVAGCETCLCRPPRGHEISQLMQFYEETRADFAKAPEKAMAMASEPNQSPPADSNVAEFAAWTAVGNILLNLDETLMKP